MFGDLEQEWGRMEKNGQKRARKGVRKLPSSFFFTPETRRALQGSQKNHGGEICTLSTVTGISGHCYQGLSKNSEETRRRHTFVVVGQLKCIEIALINTQIPWVL